MCKKMIIYLFQLVIPLYVPLRPLKRSRSHIKVKVTHQGQGQIKVNIKLRSFLRRDTLTRVVCIWIKCVLVVVMWPNKVGSCGWEEKMWYLAQTMFHKCNVKVNIGQKALFTCTVKWVKKGTVFPKSRRTKELSCNIYSIKGRLQSHWLISNQIEVL